MTSRDSKRKRAFRAFSLAADRRGRSPPRARDQRASRAYYAAMARQGKKLKAKRRAQIAASVRRKLQRAQKRAGGKDDYGVRLLRRKPSPMATISSCCATCWPSHQGVSHEGSRID